VQGWGFAQTAQRRALTPADFARMCLPEAHWRAKLQGVQGSVQQVVHNYLFKIESYISRGVGLFIVGEGGVGKTSIAALVAKEARMRGHTVFFTPVYAMREAVKARIEFDSDVSYLKRCRDVDVLVLDDLTLTDLAGFDARLVDELVHFRKQSRRLTVITTSELPSALVEKAPRLGESMLGALVTLEVTGPNLNVTNHEALSKEVLGA
jgi:DNA replication protein DnaC